MATRFGEFLSLKGELALLRRYLRADKRDIIV